LILTLLLRCLCQYKRVRQTEKYAEMTKLSQAIILIFQM
jgi:hypothetical protein